MAMLILFAGTSMAADEPTCKVSLMANNNAKVKRGESITILVKATDIQAEEGISAFSTNLEYDTDIFECSIEAQGDWKETGFYEGLSLIMNTGSLQGSLEDQNLVKIILKAKSDATLGSQVFKLTDIRFSINTEQGFDVDDVSCTIEVVDDNGGNGDNPTNPGTTNPPSGNNPSGSGSSNGGNTSGGGSSSGGNTSGGSSNGGSSTQGSGSSSGGSTQGSGSSTSGKGTSGGSSSIAKDSSSSSSIPKTGITDVLIIGAIIGSIVAVIFYIKYKRAY